MTPTVVFADGHIYGSGNCHQSIPCPSSGGTLPPEQLAAAGDACIKQDLAQGGNLTFFDTTAGFDSNNCLTPNPPDPSIANKATTLTPQCCLVTLSEDSCVLHCQIMGR